MILKVACSLLIFSVLEVKSQEPCSTLIKNIAVHEGTVNTLIDFPMNSNSVRWMVYPTTQIDVREDIVRYDDTVGPDYAADYAYDNTTGLTIRKATTTAEPGHKISTSGFYLVRSDCVGYPELSFKFIVVREGPTCSCTLVDSESVQLTCSSIYTEEDFYPISAIFTFSVDDINVTTDTPPRTSTDDWYTIFISTATFTIDNYAASSSYQCTQTFSQPMDSYPDLAGNAPEFNQQCSFVCPPAITTDATITEATSTEATTTKAKTAEATTTEATTSTSTHPPAATTTPGGTPPGEDCSKARQCQPESGTDNSGIYIQRVVKAQLYSRSDKCCPNNQTCGVVVTLQNGSRYLIHDTVCNDNRLNMAVVAASCMSSDWNLVSQKNISLSIVGAFVAAGNIAQVGSIIIPGIQSCNVMMILP